MNKRSSLSVVFEGDLNRESWAEQKIRESALAVGGFSVDKNSKRSKAAQQRRLDLKAFVRGLLQHAACIFMDFIVKIFSE
jgi:hypothetical protein